MAGSYERKYARRYTRRIYHNMDNIMEQLLKVRGLFAGPHPEYVDVLDLILRMILEAQRALEAFYVAAWGAPPADWHIDRPSAK